MAKKQWVKMESWTPLECYASDPKWVVHQNGGEFYKMLRRANVKPRTFKTRAAALRAANKQNDLEGLPRVA